MKNIHDNPVGSIKKDIYIITNKINNKIYIGQSIDTEKRFASHCKGNYNNSLIDAAIQKYGKENFEYDILEKQIENYNEREKYWIKKLEAQGPNGYNILPGGEDPPYFKGELHPSAKLSDAEVDSLKKDLKETSKSLSEIANKYNISKKQVIRINQGISRASLEETFPIRKNPNSCAKLSEKDVDIILELLEFSYFFNGDIARRFGVEVHLISDINQGKAYAREGVDYPIREWKSSGAVQFTYEEVSNIIDLLKTTDKSFREIARLYGCRHDIISKINQGTAKKYKRKNIIYPIRKF